jgi:Flp pilus assembly protein TadG
MYSRFLPCCRRPGATLVETAVVIGACLIFMLAIFEYGRFVMIRQLAENAAREGARQAIISTSSATTTDIQNNVTQRLAGQPLQGLNIQVYKADPTSGANIGSWNSAQFGEAIAVQVNGSYQPMLPTFGFLPSTVNIQTRAIMLSEAN